MTGLLLVCGLLIGYEVAKMLAMLNAGLFGLHAQHIETWTDVTSVVGVLGTCVYDSKRQLDLDQHKLAIMGTALLLYFKVLSLFAALNVDIAVFRSAIAVILRSLMPFAIVLLIVMTAFLHLFRIALIDEVAF